MVFFRASVTDDYERVRERYQRELFTYIMSPVYQSMFDREGYGEDCKKIESMWRAGQREEALAAIPPALIQQRALIGSAADIRARLDDYMAVGLQTALTLPVAIPDQDYKEDTLRTISELSVK